MGNLLSGRTPHHLPVFVGGSLIHIGPGPQPFSSLTTPGSAEFSIWTREAGAGGLAIAVEGPSKAEISFEGRKDGSCGMAYVVQEPVQLEGQVNEHLQGHLDNIYHLNQNLACTEERMAYLSYERAKEIREVMDTFKSRVAKLEALQQVTQLEVTESVRIRPRGCLCRWARLLLTLATVLRVLVSSACACPVPLLSSRLRTGTALLLIGLGALAWQKQCAVPAADWQAQVPSRWRLCSGDSKPLPEGP
ncbi:testis-specific protein TEX28 [Delphinapterus leucas]|uniref:Testis-specific protein TEX28 n=1 Tax=Delphinapterus leucas TaxID=9749 RepID=A0A7F8KAW8_DELLE|nr:testis-specific protein TEX28 [Delphinapterus leucas]